MTESKSVPKNYFNESELKKTKNAKFDHNHIEINKSNVMLLIPENMERVSEFYKDKMRNFEGVHSEVAQTLAEGS